MVFKMEKAGNKSATPKRWRLIFSGVFMERKTSQLFAVFCSEIKTVCECKFSAENWNEQTRQNRSSAGICTKIFQKSLLHIQRFLQNFL